VTIGFADSRSLPDANTTVPAGRAGAAQPASATTAISDAVDARRARRDIPAVRYLLRRAAVAVALVWLVVTCTFALLHAAPGDAAQLLVPPDASRAEAARLRTELGLDRPVTVQYARWLGGALRGDLGVSFAARRPVRDVLADALPISLALGAASLALSFVAGVLMGFSQGARRGTRADAVATVLTTALYAAPSFWLALALVATFTYGAARWGFPPALRLPAFAVRDPAGTFTGLAALADLVRHAALPVLTLSAVGAAGVARYARLTAANLADADWVRTARAKGLDARGVWGRHVLRAALPPLVVLLALTLPGIVAGSVFVESVFAWPGMGRVLVSAIGARDYPVVMGTAMLYATLTVAANLAADLALPALDPRRRDS
jgi:peptide/nickel transport system permease protein